MEVDIIMEAVKYKSQYKSPFRYSLKKCLI